MIHYSKTAEVEKWKIYIQLIKYVFLYMPPLKKSLDTTLPPQAAESYLYPVSCDVSFMGKEKDFSERARK